MSCACELIFYIDLHFAMNVTQRKWIPLWYAHFFFCWQKISLLELNGKIVIISITSLAGISPWSISRRSNELRHPIKNYPQLGRNRRTHNFEDLFYSCKYSFAYFLFVCEVCEGYFDQGWSEKTSEPPCPLPFPAFLRYMNRRQWHNFRDGTKPNEGGRR